MSFQPSAPTSGSVRIPVTSSTTPLCPPDCATTSHSDNPGDEDQFASWVQFAKSQRALRESAPSTLILNRSNSITGSLRRRRAPQAGPLYIPEVPTANAASQEEIEPIIDDDRPSPLIRALTPKQRLVQVKRSLKMAQMFGQLPPPSLYQNNVRLTFHTDVESHSDEDPVAPRKDSESDPGELSDYTIGEDDEDTASGFGKIRPLPIPPRPKERSPVQSTYPYLSTLPDIVPLSPLRDAPFGQYPSRLIAPIEPPQRTTPRRPAPIRVMPDPPKSPRWIPEDETLSIAKQRRASISGMDILRESQHSQSRSHRNSRSGSHSANTSISSTMSTSSSVSDDLSFQARRKRATKLARFFGVEYNDIHAVGTNPLAPPSSQSSCDTSSSAASSSGSKAGFIGPPRGDEPVVSVPHRPRHLQRSQSRARSMSKPQILSMEESKAAKEKVVKGVRVINPRDDPQDVREVLVRLRAMR